MRSLTARDATTFSLKRNFANMITMLRSEIARLIFGYLKDNCSIEIAEMFLNTCPYLDECRKMKKNGRMFNCKIQGNTLEQILDKFDALNWFIPQLTTEENCSHKNLLTLLQSIINSKLNLLNTNEPNTAQINIPIREPVLSSVVTQQVENVKNSSDRTNTVADHDTVHEQSSDTNTIVTNANNSANPDASVEYSSSLQTILQSALEKTPQPRKLVTDAPRDDVANPTACSIFSDIEKDNQNRNTSPIHTTDQNTVGSTEKTDLNGYSKPNDISTLSAESVSNDISMGDGSLPHEPQNAQIMPTEMNHSFESVSSKENENVFQNVGKTFGRPFFTSPKKPVENAEAFGYDHINRISHIYTTPAKQRPRDSNIDSFETSLPEIVISDSEDTNNTSEDTVMLSADREQNTSSSVVASKKESIPWDLKDRAFIGDGAEFTAHISKRKNLSDSSKSKKKKETSKKRKLNDDHDEPIKNDTKRMRVNRSAETEKSVSKNNAKIPDSRSKSTPKKSNQMKGSTPSRPAVNSNSKTESKHSIVRKEKQPVAKECMDMMILEPTSKPNNIDSTIENVVNNNEQNANNERKLHQENSGTNGPQSADSKSNCLVQSQNNSLVEVTSPSRSNIVSNGEIQNMIDLEVTSSDQMSNDAPLELQVSAEFVLFSVLPKSNQNS